MGKKRIKGEEKKYHSTWWGWGMDGACVGDGRVGEEYCAIRNNV